MILQASHKKFSLHALTMGFLTFVTSALMIGCENRVRSSTLHEETISKATETVMPATNSEVDRNRKLWLKAKIADYKMTLRMLVSSYSRPAEPVRITIRNGQAISIVPESSDKRDIEPYHDFETIEKIFDQIEKEQLAGRTVKVKYNKKYGYPEDTTIFRDDSNAFRSVAIVGMDFE